MNVISEGYTVPNVVMQIFTPNVPSLPSQGNDIVALACQADILTTALASVTQAL